MQIIKKSVVFSLVVSSAVLSGCKASNINTTPVGKELAAYSVSPQALNYVRTTKDLKGKVRSAELHSIENDLYHYKTSDGYAWANYLNPMLPSPTFSGEDWGTGTQEMTKVKGAMFPLVVGNKMSYTVKGESTKWPDGWNETRKCEVKSQERVTTEAGEFDTFKVICNSEWRQRIFYFAPEINDIVLHRNIHKTEPQKNSGWDLVGISS